MALVPGGNKAKGATAERELAALLTDWGQDIGIALNLMRNLEQVRSGGHDLIGIPGLATECKRVEVLAISSWWEQTVRQGLAAGAIPFLAYRQNRKKWKFMTETWVWPCTGQRLVVSMDEAQAKLWFQAHIIAEMQKKIEGAA